jgi:hypothetical protein
MAHRYDSAIGCTTNDMQPSDLPSALNGLLGAGTPKSQVKET